MLVLGHLQRPPSGGFATLTVAAWATGRIFSVGNVDDISSCRINP